MGRLLGLFAALFAAVLIAWTGEQPPKPAPASAPASAFSAVRAMADIVAIASVPHPIGSDANHAARDKLMTRMTALGLSPQVHPGVGLWSRKFGADLLVTGGDVENLVGVLPGRDRSAPAVALMAHYDSVAGSPGAADDAAGVATALETMRALKARGVPARDVIILLTDGEEAGLLGSDAFFNRDPMAGRIGFIFNMEARGAAGRVQMFQTSDQNGGAIDLFRHTATDPHASSLTGFVYAQMPNDTDFTVVRKHGIAGLNYAFLGHQFEYHSPTSTPATMDLGTLQDMGQQVLATAQAIAFSTTLPAKAPDLVYGQTLAGVVVAYPPLAGWLVLLVAGGLIIVAASRAQRLEAFAWTDVAHGVGAGLVAVLGACAVMHFARRATGVAFGFAEQRALLAQADRWELALFLLGLGFLIFAAAELARGRRFIALVPLAAGLGSCAFGGLDKLGLGLGAAAAVLAVFSYGRPVSRAGAWCGVLVLGLALAIAAQAFAPIAANVVAWPLALASLAAAASAFTTRRGTGGLLVVALLAAIGLGWVGGLAHAAYLSLDLTELLGLPLLLAALLIWPLAQPDEGAPPARLVGPVLLVAGFAVLISVARGQPYDARHPQMTYVGYHIDQDAGRAWRFSNALGRTAWTNSTLTADGGALMRLSHWSYRHPVLAAVAPYISEAAPDITLVKQPGGELKLHVAPPPGARTVMLVLKPDTAISIADMAGVASPFALRPGGKTIVQWEAAQKGFDLTLRPGGPGKLEVGYIATLDRWPASAKPLAPRPTNLMAFDTSDSTSLTGTRRFSW